MEHFEISWYGEGRKFLGSDWRSCYKVEDDKILPNQPALDFSNPPEGTLYAEVFEPFEDGTKEFKFKIILRK